MKNLKICGICKNCNYGKVCSSPVIQKILEKTHRKLGLTHDAILRDILVDYLRGEVQ